MPARSTISTLPEAVRKWLDESLVESDFSGYESLTAALSERGYTLSKSSLHRYGQAFQQKLDAIKQRTEMAKAITTYIPDDEGSMTDALNRILQDKIFQLLETLDAETLDPKIASTLARATADLSRATIAQKKHTLDLQERQRQAKEKLQSLTRKSNGLSEEALREIESTIKLL